MRFVALGGPALNRTRNIALAFDVANLTAS